MSCCGGMGKRSMGLTVILLILTCESILSAYEHFPDLLEVNGSLDQLSVQFHILEVLSKSLGWTNFILISDKDVPGLVKLLSKASVKVQANQIGNHNNFSRIFSKSHLRTTLNRIIVWCATSRTSEVINAAGKFQMFALRYSWLIIGKDKEEMNEIFRRNVRVFREDSQVCVALLISLKHIKMMQLQYRLHSTKFLFEIGEYQWPIGMRIHRIQEDFQLKNYSVILGIFNFPPMSTVNCDRTGMCSTGGFMKTLTVILSEVLQFKFDYIVDETRTFGNLLTNKSWNGIVGMLHRKEIAISSIGLTVTKERMDVIDFSPFIATIKMVAIVKTPSLLKRFDLFLYWQPLSFKAWIAFISTCLLLLIINRVTETESENKHEILRKSKDDEQSPNIRAINKNFFASSLYKWKMPDYIFIIYRRGPRRIVVYSSIMMIFLVKMLYEASLTASMTISRNYCPFESIEDTLRDRKFRYGIYAASTYYQLIQDTNVDPFPALWAVMSADPESKVSSIEIGFRKASQEKFVYFADTLNSGFHLVNYKCQLIALKREYFRKDLHFGFPKNSALGFIFNFYIGKIHSSGILKRITEYELTTFDSNKCFDEEISTNSITLQQTIVAFMILLSGVVISFLTLLLEIFYFKFISH